MSERREVMKFRPGWDVIVIVSVLAVLLALPSEAPWLATFTTYFLAVLLEAIPFLLLGSILASAIRLLLPEDLLPRLAARMGVWGVPGVALASAVFPVCECGVVAVGRGLLRKGLPLRHTVVYLLAAPIFNPVVILSTLIAFAYDYRFAAVRAAGGLLVPMGVGLLVGGGALKEALLPKVESEFTGAPGPGHYVEEGDGQSTSIKLIRVLEQSRSDFLDMLPYLMFGVACAAAMQTFLGSRVLTVLGQGPVIGPAVMMSTAFTLSLCSEADAFVGATFIQFDFPAVISFLVLGPMLDIKLLLMYRGIFKSGFILRMSLCTVILTALYVAVLTAVI